MQRQPLDCDHSMLNRFRHHSVSQRQTLLGSVVLVGLLMVSSKTAWSQEPDISFSDVTASLNDYCRDCHGDGAEEGGFALEEVEEERSLADGFERWELIRQRIADQSMPPKDAEQPTKSQPSP